MDILVKNRSRVAELEKELTAITSKAALTVEDIAAINKITAEIEQIEVVNDAARKMQKAAGDRSLPGVGDENVLQQPDENGRVEVKGIKRVTEGKAYAEPKKVEKAFSQIAIFGGALAKQKLTGNSALAILEDDGYYSIAKDFHEFNRKTLNTGTGSAGGYLLPTPLANEIIELLYPETTFFQAGPRRVELVNNKLEIPGGASGSTAGWVAEAGAKPYTEPTFRKIDLQGKKLAGIVAMTQEQVKFSLPNIQAFVEADLRMSMGQQLDIAAWLGSGSGAVPQGILNKSGIGSFTATNSLTPTIAQIDSDIAKLTLWLETNNIRTSSGFVFVMNPRTFTYIANLRDGISGYAYPTMNQANPTLRGIRVLKTNNFPINLGGGTNESIIALVDFTHVLYGQSMDLLMRTSDVASVDMGSGMVSAFQNNLIYLLMEMMADVEIRINAAVAKLTAVKWGA